MINLTNQGLLSSILTTLRKIREQEHIEHLAELSIIENSSQREEYARQLFANKILVPLEKVHQKIQDAGKEMQKRAERVGTYREKYELSTEEADIIARDFREIACRIAEINSFSDLKDIYRVISDYLNEVSSRQNPKWSQDVVYKIRKNILEPLSDSIAETNKFYMRQHYAARLALISDGQNTYLN